MWPVSDVHLRVCSMAFKSGQSVPFGAECGGEHRASIVRAS